ncbi:MAG: valine--tRNA ligase [Candidatus Omnitrophica bacterium]|nr:valine--tRNA ligase [Candidatus Omnitrophota bacterium]
MELPSRYNPGEVEDKWYKFWEESALFHTEPDPKKKPFCIVIPPPNVTGILHMGHALNNTIQDILVRYKRMRGFTGLWIPGTDHAGIATQNVVEKSLAREGLSRQHLGREKFLEKVWFWKEQYGTTIINQLKRLGCSCDWQRLRFTMDEGLSEAVLEVFVRLYDKGLIYRGNYIINWCPRCQTALSDEEAPHQETQGNLYYLKYPLKDKSNEFVVVATTRPETMLGDTAVAVNPKDKRYKKLIGKILILPLVNREIKIISDSLVDIEFGTGAVKVTPAHDPNDYMLGKKHNLEFINVMHPDGRMNENASRFNGQDRFKCRELILEELRSAGLLEKTEPHLHAVGHCYRCHTAVEPYLSRQWFVRMKPLAVPAINAVKEGSIKFYPKRWTKVYLDWMENIRDWCISRQIWWGHRLPVYYCRKCQEAEKSEIRNPKSETNSKQESGVIVSRTKPEKCPVFGSCDIVQDEDVLDTWFSSWLWPFSTMGWPEIKSKIKNQKANIEDLKYFYPTSVLVTAQEIIFFWVARMIMAGIEFMDDIPFKNVYIHGTVRDLTGKKMSKSLGNIIDPIKVINEFGADALRFSIISITAAGQDVFLSDEKFHLGRNFANKIWNASRFILANVSQPVADSWLSLKKDDLSLADRWILSRLQKVTQGVTEALERYDFNEAAGIIYQFFWHEFCDWYIEIVKPILVTSNQPIVTGQRQKETKQFILIEVLETSLRLLHPMMPFVTEEIWQKVKPLNNNETKSIMLSSWPGINKKFIDEDAEIKIRIIQDMVVNVRNIVSEMEVPLDKKIELFIKAPAREVKFLKENLSYLKTLLRTEHMNIASDTKRPKFSCSSVVKDIELYVPLEGIIDLGKERKRISEKLQAIESGIDRASSKLEDKEFTKRAPSDIVEKEKLRHQGLLKEKDKWQNYLKNIQH